MGPKQGTSILSELDEGLIVAVPMKTLLPLDDALHALQPLILQLSRSMLTETWPLSIAQSPAAAG